MADVIGRSQQYVWDVSTLQWVKMRQPILEGGTVVIGGAMSATITDPLGQDTMANSVAVTMASDQTPIIVLAI